jgi:hypothetical protein
MTSFFWNISSFSVTESISNGKEEETYEKDTQYDLRFGYGRLHVIGMRRLCGYFDDEGGSSNGSSDHEGGGNDCSGNHKGGSNDRSGDHEGSGGNHQGSGSGNNRRQGRNRKEAGSFQDQGRHHLHRRRERRLYGFPYERNQGSLQGTRNFRRTADPETEHR